MTEDQCYWYERGLHAGKSQAAEMQGYKEAYFALLESITEIESVLRPAPTIVMQTPQRTWVGLTLQDREALRDRFEGWNYSGILVDVVFDMIKEKNT